MTAINLLLLFGGEGDGQSLCPVQEHAVHMSAMTWHAGETGLEVCPGREATSETALETEWTDMDPIPGNQSHCLAAFRQFQPA